MHKFEFAELVIGILAITAFALATWVVALTRQAPTFVPFAQPVERSQQVRAEPPKLHIIIHPAGISRERLMQGEFTSKRR
jgi:hypothetical protein